MKKSIASVFFVCLCTSLFSTDILLEVKGAYFLPTGSRFADIYQNGGGLYGTEVSFQFFEKSHWYAFTSADYFHRKGKSLGYHSSTTIDLVPLAAGLKYFIHTPSKSVDVYAGLGVQPIYVHIENSSPYVVSKEQKWVCGGIAKLGSYFYLPRNFLFDLFIDYSYARISSSTKEGPSGPVVPLSTSISGVIFGGGVGYRF